MGENAFRAPLQRKTDPKMATFDPPKPKYRRKDVPCGICNTPTKDTGGVCGDCRANARLGAALRQSAEAPKPEDRTLKRLAFPAERRLSFVYSHVHGNMTPVERAKSNEVAGWDYDDIEAEILALMLRLAGTEALSHRYTGNLTVLMTEAQEKAYYELRSCITAICRYASKEGEKRGKDFIKGLADGSVSYQDLQADIDRDDD